MPSPLIEKIKKIINEIKGVDAAFLDDRCIYLVAREHDCVDYQEVLSAEDILNENKFEISIRAHQGRDPQKMFPGLYQLI